MGREVVLGTTRVTNGWKISLNKDVRKVLERDGEPVKLGDRLMYVLTADGEVTIRKPFVHESQRGRAGAGRDPAPYESPVPEEATRWIGRDAPRGRR